MKKISIVLKRGKFEFQFSVKLAFDGERERDRERISNVIFIFCLTSPHTYRPPTYFRFVCIDKLFRKQESHLWGKDRRIHFWKKNFFKIKKLKILIKKWPRTASFCLKTFFQTTFYRHIWRLQHDLIWDRRIEGKHADH